MLIFVFFVLEFIWGRCKQELKKALCENPAENISKDAFRKLVKSIATKVGEKHGKRLERANYEYIYDLLARM